MDGTHANTIPSPLPSLIVTFTFNEAWKAEHLPAAHSGNQGRNASTISKYLFYSEHVRPAGLPIRHATTRKTCLVRFDNVNIMSRIRHMTRHCHSKPSVGSEVCCHDKKDCSYT